MAGLIPPDPYGRGAFPIGENANPYAVDRGIGQLGPTLADMKTLGDSMVPSLDIKGPRMRAPPTIAFSPSSKKLFVNGMEFAADDAATALESEQMLNQEATPLPRGDWVQLDEGAFGQYLQSIKNPSLTRLAKKNFGIGVDSSQMLGGRLMQFLGAEKAGQQVVGNQLEDLRKTEPFNRQFTDIGSQENRGILDWFVANMAQQGPNLVESALTALAGGVMGAAAGGGPNPLSAAGGALLAMAGKTEFKQAVLAAAKKHAAGQVLNAQESKILREAAGITAAAQIKAAQSASKGLVVRRAGGPNAIDQTTSLLGDVSRHEALNTAAAKTALAGGREQAVLGGITAASLGQNYATGIADLYGESIEKGNPDRFAAAQLGIPYALLETAPEFLLASRMFAGVGHGKLGTTPLAGLNLGGKALELTKRAATGFVVGGISEGATEAGQESLLLDIGDTDWDSDEGISRLVNSFAAGFGVGGPIGAAGGLFPGGDRNAPTNMLQPGKSPEPTANAPEIPKGFGGYLGGPPQTANALVPVGAAGPGMAGTSLLGGPEGGGGPAATTFPAELGQMAAGPGTILTGEGEVPTGPGTQGVLPLFESMPTAEMAARMQPPAITQQAPEAPPAAPVVNPDQGALQFAPEAPPLPPVPQGALGLSLAEAIEQERRRAQVDAAKGQREGAERTQKLGPEYDKALAQRELQDAQGRPAAKKLEDMPTVAAKKTTPQQLSLFRRRETPRPSTRENLRRGRRQPTQKDVAEKPTTPGEFQKAGQLTMFTQEGKPSMAALKGAGKTQATRAEPSTAGETQIPPTGKNVTPLSVAVARQKEEAKAGPTRGLKKGGVEAVSKVETPPALPTKAPPVTEEKTDAVQKRGAAALHARESSEAGAGVGGKVPAQGQAAGTRNTLRKGKAENKTIAGEQAAAGEVAPVLPKEAPPVTPEPNVPKSEAATAPSEVAAETKPEATITEEVKAQAKRENKERVEVAAAIELVETTKSDKTCIDAIAWLFESLYNGDTNTKAAGADKMIVDFLNSLAVDSLFREGLRQFARNEGTLRIVRRTGSINPIFEHILRANMLQSLKQVATFESLPAEYAIPSTVPSPEDLARDAAALAASEKEALRAAREKARYERLFRESEEEAAPKPGAAARLAKKIREFNASTTKLNESLRRKRINTLKELWKEVTEAGSEEFMTEAGVPLSAYFVNGEPITNTMEGGRFTVGTEKISSETRAKAEADLRAQAKPQKMEEGDYVSSSKLDDWNTFGTGSTEDSKTRYFDTSGEPITKGVPHGRVHILVAQFVSKLFVKPKRHVYRNQADFKKNAPEAYERARAGRTEDDFDRASIAGVSFGNGEIAIFTDRIATEQQLRFILAHEVLGHFGFRAIMPEVDLRGALEAVYQSSARIRHAVNMAMAANPKLSRSEATEEYLADMAGTLDTNILSRFWNFVKGALNRLGAKFEDDMARYVIGQSRAYVRNGKLDPLFHDFAAMAKRWSDIETMGDPLGTTRYFQSAEYSDEYSRMAADQINARSTDLDADEIERYLKAKAVNAGDFWKRVIGDLRTMNYAARENFGYRKLYEILRDTVHTAARLRSKYNYMMRTLLQPASELGSYRLWGKGKATREQIGVVNGMANLTSRVKMHKATMAELRAAGPLFTFEGGEPKLNEEAFNKLKEMGRLTVEQFAKGFTYQEQKARPMTAARRSVLAAERDAAIAKQKDPAKHKAITEDYEAQMEAPTYFETVEETYDPVKGGTQNLTADSIEWKMYLQMRDTMDESARDLLHANFAAAQGQRDNVLRIVERFLGRKLSSANEKFIKKVQEQYLTLRYANASTSTDGFVTVDPASVNKANDFIIKFNKAMLGLKTDRNAAVQEFFERSEADDIHAGIEALKAGSAITHEGQEQYAMQQAIQNLALFEVSTRDAELSAKKTIAGGYVPFGREGGWQVRIQAVDPETGRVLKVKDIYAQQLFYSQMGDKAEALRQEQEVNDVLAGAKDGFEMEVLGDDQKYHMKRVKLQAVASTARKTVATTSEANLNEVIGVLARHSISIRPDEREKLVLGLTKQNHRARQRLPRAGTPGESKDTLKFVSQHLEAIASIVARKQNRHKLDRLFDEKDGDSRRLWHGSEEEYARLKFAHEAAQKNSGMSEERKQAARRDFEDYHYVYKVKDSQQNAARYKDMGQRLVGFLEAQTDVEFTDFGSSEIVSRVRMGATMAQMGLSPAVALLNYLSLATNVWPSLAGYNPKNGFGGGFGWANVASMMTDTLAQTKSSAQSDEAYWRELLADQTDKKLEAAGFTRLEAEFMFKEVGSGSMQAALTNALLGSARGKITSGLKQSIARGWMSMFNYSEQAARRSTGLAAFRLAFKRAQAEGKNTAESFEIADRFAVDMIENTLGQYAMFNRPAMFRGGVQQFIFMYKMFPVNAIQMLSAMKRRDQLLALGILMMFTGLKGIPFIDDFMDILDSIAQALGLGPRGLWKGSSEKTLASFLNWVSPGLTPLAMRGLLNHLTPANVSDRMSMGNIIPGSGIFLAGADVGREITEILGPVASFGQGMISASAQAARFGLGPSEQKAIEFARTSPFTALRAAGDMWAYGNTGAIVSQKGSIVSKNLHAGVFLTRALGFYPSSAVAENDVVRMNKRLMDYRKDVAAVFRSRYVAARLGNDSEAAQDVFKSVANWNQHTKSMGMDIPNFQRSANASLREAKRSATERYLRTLPKNARPEAERTMHMLMTESEVTAD